jgi:hypothetical protein
MAKAQSLSTSNEFQTNLDSIFATNKVEETEGVWFDFPNGVSFRCRRFGNYNQTRMKQAMAAYYKPFARQIENGLLPLEKEREIMIKVFVEVCLVEWKGIKANGEDLAYSQETAVRLFLKLPDLFDKLFQEAQSADNFRVELGNC